MIKVIKPGMLTTVQDLGRFGYAHLGLSPGGAADTVLFRCANRLVGNRENAPALECTRVGPTLSFTTRAIVAVAVIESSESFTPMRAFEVGAGATLEVGPIARGARAYIAVRGGFKIPQVMGSASTFLPAQIGGVQGRALRSGDELEIGDHVGGPTANIDCALIKQIYRGGPLRVTPSIHFDRFEAESFVNRPFTVTEKSNRSGLRLDGQSVKERFRHELLTQGVSLGAIQIPADGKPIVLFVDQQTTGGYPIIANVIAADLPRVAQLRPRDEVRFEIVTIEEAIELLRAQEQCLSEAFRS